MTVAPTQTLDVSRGGRRAGCFGALPSGGRALELACGTGLWTRRLVRHADTVTAVDASPEVIELARAGLDDPKVDYVRADLFAWEPPDLTVVLSPDLPAHFERVIRVGIESLALDISPRPLCWIEGDGAFAISSAAARARSHEAPGRTVHKGSRCR